MTPGARILVTGGSGGIGGAIASACAQRGAWPLVGYCHSEQSAREVVRRCSRGEICPIDLRAATLSIPAVEAVVHCAAAYAPERSLLEGDETMLEELLQVNVLGPLRLTRAAASASPSPKRIVFVLSSAAFCRGTGPYALSKAAELALCRLLANELAGRGLRIDAIVPGWTDTPMAARAAAASGRSLGDISRDHPGGRILRPDEVGQLCASLLFDHSDSPPGTLIAWDLRDAADPVWRPLHNSTAAYADARVGWADPGAPGESHHRNNLAQSRAAN